MRVKERWGWPEEEKRQVVTEMFGGYWGQEIDGIPSGASNFVTADAMEAALSALLGKYELRKPG